jgi:phosphopantetheinyl transferase
MARVLVLHARLGDDPDPARFATLLARLPYARRLELERRDSRDRYASLAGAWLVLEGASRLLGRTVTAGELRFPEGGKPTLAARLCFSVSHGGARVAAAVSESVDVGFDMEEGGTGLAGSSEYRAKLERWTATEAVLKAAGRGLRDAKSVEIDTSLTAGRLHGTTYGLTRVTIAEPVIAHLAASGPVERVDVIEVELPRVA